MDLTGLNELSFNEFSPPKTTTSQQQQPQQQPQPIQNAPPLPPRNQSSSYTPQTYPTTNPLQYNSYSAYSNSLGPSFYNYNPMSSSLYSPYSQAASVATNNSFVRAAEESTRGAFQSIESVVQAFSAVSAMFESTYYAVFNSFRAVVGVADQFYRLKTHLSGIVSAFALFKFFKYIYRKFMRGLKVAAAIITNTNPNSLSEKHAWSMASKLGDTEKFVKSSHQTNWPLIMFLAVVFGGPWLIWKILSSINNKDDNLWMQGKIDHFVAVAEFDFDAVNVDEITFRRGQKIIIAPKEYQPRIRGWLLGSLDGKTQGIMPANYIKILGKKSGETP